MVIAGAAPCVPLVIRALVGVMIRRHLGGINFFAYEDEIRFFDACRVADGKRVESGAFILVFIPAGVAAHVTHLRFMFLREE
ncbi:hypothetical protein [Dialister invisus]